MAWKESRLYSIFKFKCPRCHEGDMFTPGTLFNPAKFSKMYPKCSCCGQSFEPEPGYYFGAMFVSYAINTALFVAVWVALNVILGDYSITTMVVTIVIMAILFLSLIFRLSRSIWINIFIGYEGPCDQIPKKQGFK
ncbi:DUF983 domain-containing protein [Telluribacter sp.]|jgi:uncharacterized protein (DUF983 family)|uniref:DUF983 domain-containing protein n=1 Tax=Telluribacter sp. TaxID=1978767 RepID=UPI002E0F6AF5|nr:DUF983 domain-containing protein [Telluribacter sp.]